MEETGLGERGDKEPSYRKVREHEDDPDVDARECCTSGGEGK